MLKIQRNTETIDFLFEEPLQESLFIELKEVLQDYIKLGKTHFRYDFTGLQAQQPPIFSEFDSLVPLLQAKKCTLLVQGDSYRLLDQLPKTQSFLSYLKKSFTEKHRFSLASGSIGNQALLEIKGDFIELQDLEDFKALALKLLQSHNKLIVNCSALQHISTIAVGGFIFLKVHCDNTQKSISLSQVSESVRYTLEMTGILHIIPLSD